ncbi:Activating molecule in BECN1-regulated autophagy protein 1 [Camellia lanceoleosa]|uniref:Activating molecule in BECN1-regulated autophagy protein 1 n=1 Tax=Camellia lanceoleosa TaxID=1840588 RepID=A0ACC0F6N9_9ERIC|nr:Activating molecule in BECN1-regulated autophagy protein 1 [Camellia lanceoleosa]
MKQMTRRPSIDDTDKASYCSSKPRIHHSSRNVFSLLARREVAPRTKSLPRWQWGDVSKGNTEISLGPQSEAVRDARRGLFSWVEEESLRHLSAKYCSLVPPPRSTIAAAFSPDGKTLASTHGDHTVKIIDCQTGSCLKVLSGHRRTPWVVRFHPEHPEILASGSLDHEVRLWDANTSECIGSRDFYRPIASIAFHAEGEVLAVASGHKLYIWHYNRKGETSSPVIVLKTRRSLRAVHFHPHGAPLLLTAEVNDLDSSDSSMTQATSLGSLHYPPPAVYVANVRSSDRLSMAAELPSVSLPFLYLPSFASVNPRTDLQLGNRPVDRSRAEVGSSASVQFRVDANPIEQHDHTEMSPAIASNSDAAMEETLTNYCPTGLQDSVGDTTIDAMETTEVQLVEGYPFEASGVPRSIGLPLDRVSIGTRHHQFLHSRDPTCWELPFVQGWLMGQSQAGMPPTFPVGDRHGPPSRYFGAGSAMLTYDLPACNEGIPGAPLAMPSSVNRTVFSGGSGLQDHSLRTRLISASDSGQVLVSRAIRAAHCLTSIQFSPTSEHILLAYGRRHSSLLKSIVINGETSLPIYTVLEVYRVSDMELVSVLRVQKMRSM